MTAGLTLVLTIYAIVTKTDFTVWLSFMWLVLGALLMFGLFAIIFRSQWMNVMYCFFAIIVYGVYLMIDTQLIIGNKKYKLGVDDYAIAVLILYIDIIVLFLMILRLLGGRR